MKTITIDLEAYALLARRKHDGRSFSQVIKAHFGRQPTVADFLAAVKASRIGDDALRAMERQVKRRKADRARAVTL